MATAREVALQTLIDTLVGGAYSNHALNDQFSKNELSPQDKNFATEIVYGTLQNHRLLEFYMEPYLNGKAKKWVRLLIEMTLYQIIFLDSVPEHAAVSEAVAIAKKRGGDFNGKLVNAISREVLRHELRTFEQITDEAEALGIQTSHPTWLIKLWMKQYGRETTMQMLKANNERVQVSIRVNTVKCTKEQLKAILTNEGITVRNGYLSPDALIVEKGNAIATQAFKDG
ncbi:MAG TPA: 16S rRNA (cytosine(967)-C(5))-methyltransferase RsmB, partial [Firmicutes bacterium]|nr:16S rRNA (cytosine(967)-C(5))-methyltransferase RsmB [Bacillota bacterium]